jgi:hypothetical protein
MCSAGKITSPILYCAVLLLQRPVLSRVKHCSDMAAHSGSLLQQKVIDSSYRASNEIIERRSTHHSGRQGNTTAPPADLTCEQDTEESCPLFGSGGIDHCALYASHLGKTVCRKGTCVCAEPEHCIQVVWTNSFQIPILNSLEKSSMLELTVRVCKPKSELQNH